jgi:hypothetical protein
MTVLWSDSRAEFTPVYNGVVRALLTPDDYNQQPFRETTPPGRVYSLFYFPFERCEPPRDRNHGAVCGYLRNCLTNTRGRARPRYFCNFFFTGLHGLVVVRDTWPPRESTGNDSDDVPRINYERFASTVRRISFQAQRDTNLICAGNRGII